jgi:plastocyanin
VGQSCGAGEAQILVQDGYLEDLCGCAEPAGKSYTQPAPLTCTVPAGTTVFLIFEGAVRPHQIISSGTPSFPSSTLWDPPNGNFINPHFAYQFSQTGTYAFFDAFDPAMTGSIISQ